MPALIIGISTTAATVGVGAPGHGNSAAEGDDNRTVAVSAKPTPYAADAAAPDPAAPTSHPTPVATTIALGGGPLLGVAVTEGVTPIADEVVPPVPTDDSEAVATNDTRGEDRTTQSGDLDESTAETASASDTIGAAGGVLIPLGVPTHVGRADASAPAETSVRKGKLASAPLKAGAPAGTNLVTSAAISPDGRWSQAKADDLSRETSFTDVARNTPAGAAAHHAGPLLSFNIPPIALAPGAAAVPTLCPAVARAGGGDIDVAALREVTRLYAPHDGTAPSGGASGFARLGTIGQDTGVALARGVADGRDHVTLRLDPPDLGRIDVQLSFGQDGGLRAVVASDNRAALDLLRRDLDQLQRALADAGVRADAQSFHFSERQSGGSQRWDAPIPRDQRYAAPAATATDRPSASPAPRRLRASGLIDVFA
nr:flagellar hook-length control protein FliK [Sphingomonas yunnanensis]